MFKKILFALIAAFSLSFAVAAVNINTATAVELQTLKGIGAKKAAEIITYREQNGPFKTVDDLVKVKGIGPATVEKNRAELTVTANPPATAQKSAKPVTQPVKK